MFEKIATVEDVARAVGRLKGEPEQVRP
jgi:hypothetical protein